MKFHNRVHNRTSWLSHWKLLPTGIGSIFLKIELIPVHSNNAYCILKDMFVQFLALQKYKVFCFIATVNVDKSTK